MCPCCRVTTILLFYSPLALFACEQTANIVHNTGKRHRHGRVQIPSPSAHLIPPLPTVSQLLRNSLRKPNPHQWQTRSRIHPTSMPMTVLHSCLPISSYVLLCLKWQPQSATSALSDILKQIQGLPCVVTLKNGDCFSGIFSGGSPDTSDSRYILKMVKRTESRAQQSNGVANNAEEYIGEGDDHAIAFETQDVVDLSVPNVSTDKTRSRAPNGQLSESEIRWLCANFACRRLLRLQNRRRHIRQSCSSRAKPPKMGCLR